MEAAPKKKRRYSDKRRQMSREAARFRRSNEAHIFAELHSVLPCSSVPPQLDKASIVRIVISFLKLHRVISDVLDISDRPVSLTALDYKFDHLYLKALDGFVMVITKDGEVIYISENVDTYLGLLQVDVIGHSIFDLTHPCDHEDVRDLMSDSKWRHHVVTSASSLDDGLEPPRPHRELFIRMKSSLVSKGHFPTFKSSAYRVVHCCGHSVPATDGLGVSCVLLTGRLIPHPSFVDVPLDSQSFVSWHNMDMTFMHCDDRVCRLLGFSSHELIGKSLYLYHHVLDSEMLERAYRTLFAKGQVVTGPYRFLASLGGYAWLVTQATVINSSSSDKTQCVVCISNVISDVEEQDLVLSDIQLPTKREIIECDDLRDEVPSSSSPMVTAVSAAAMLGSKCLEVKVKRDVMKDEDRSDADHKALDNHCADDVDIDEDEDDDEVGNDNATMDLSKMKFATEMIVKKFAHNISAICLNVEDAVAHNEPSSHGIVGSSDFHSSLLEKLGKLQHNSNSDTVTSSSSQDLHTIPSNNSLYTLLENLQQNEFEQRAPYISMDDMFFGDDRDDVTTTCSARLVSETSTTESSSVSSGVFFTSGDADDSYIDSSPTRTVSTTCDATPSLGVGHTPLYYTPAVMAARHHGMSLSMPCTPSPPPYWQNSSQQQTVADSSGCGSTVVAPSSVVGSTGLHNCSSILMNLLVTGRDVNFGYQLDSLTGDGTGSVPGELYRMLCSK
jgi:PAS domain-containing protein